MSATLYLIPTPLATTDTPCLLPHEQALMVGITDFIVEAEKTARAHLKALGVTTPIRELSMHTLNEHTDAADIPALLEPLKQGRDVGLVSEAGCPAVADPGSSVVRAAHALGLPGASPTWGDPMPDLPDLHPVARVVRDVRWAVEFFTPWAIRRIRGVSLGDGRSPKRPELTPVVAPVHC